MPNREAGVYVEGLAAMQRVLFRAGHELGPELRLRLKAAVEQVRVTAQADAPSRSGRLRASIRVSVTQRSASLYSTAIYGGVQNYGGKVGRDHATLLKRAEVSQYMTRAAQSNKERVAREVEGVLDWLTHQLEEG